MQERARKAAGVAEVYLHSSSSTPVVFQANKLKSLETKESTALTLRVIKAGRIGITSTSRLQDPQLVVDAALASAAFGAEARFEFPPIGQGADVDVYDERTPKFPVEKMVEAGKDLIARLLDYNPDLLIDVSLDKDQEEIRIIRNGAAGSYERSGFGVSASANLIRGKDILDVFAFKVACGPEVDVGALYEEMRQKLDLAREPARVKTGELPVVLTPIAVMLALRPALGAGFNGKMVEQGASPLARKVGERAFDERFSMYDDATLQRRPRSSPFDDEGVPTRRVPLVEGGVVAGFLYDLQTAGKMGTRSTGNGYRSGGSPSPSSTATVIEPGEGSLADLIGSVDEGLLVDYLLGGGQSNVLRGDFGGNLHLGFKIENGKLAGRVKDTLIAGNVYRALANIRQIGGEAEWVGGGLYCPPLALDGITVSTKA